MAFFAFAVTDEERVVVFRQRQRRGYQPVGMKPITATVAAHGDADHRDGVVIGVCHIEKLALVINLDGIRR